MHRSSVALRITAAFGIPTRASSNPFLPSCGDCAALGCSSKRNLLSVYSFCAEHAMSCGITLTMKRCLGATSNAWHTAPPAPPAPQLLRVGDDAHPHPAPTCTLGPREHRGSGPPPGCEPPMHRIGRRTRAPRLPLCPQPLFPLPRPPTSLLQRRFGSSCTGNLLGHGLKILTAHRRVPAPGPVLFFPRKKIQLLPAPSPHSATAQGLMLPHPGARHAARPAQPPHGQTERHPPTPCCRCRGWVGETPLPRQRRKETERARGLGRSPARPLLRAGPAAALEQVSQDTFNLRSRDPTKQLLWSQASREARAFPEARTLHGDDPSRFGRELPQFALPTDFVRGIPLRSETWGFSAPARTPECAAIPWRSKSDWKRKKGKFHSGHLRLS